MKIISKDRLMIGVIHSLVIVLVLIGFSLFDSKEIDWKYITYFGVGFFVLNFLFEILMKYVRDKYRG